MECRVLIRRTHGELVAIRFAKYYRSRRFHSRHRSAVEGRNIFVENLRSRRRAHAARRHHIFDRDRYSAQRRQRFPLDGHTVNAISLLECSLFAKRKERTNLSILLLDLGVMLLNQRERGRLSL